MSWLSPLQWTIVTAYLLAGAGLAHRDSGSQRAQWAMRVAVSGLLLHAAMVLVRGVHSGQIPIVTRYEDFTVDALAMVAVWFFAQWRWPSLRSAGVLLLPVAAVVSAAALLYSQGIFPMTPALRTNWLVIHASLNSLALGFATLALAAGLQPQRNGAPLVGRLLSWAFLFWGAMVAAGSYWASIAWGRFWGWDPIECWSLGTLLAYAFVLHLRMRPRWREGLRGAWVAVPPFALMLFTTYGLVFVMRSVHGRYLFQ